MNTHPASRERRLSGVRGSTAPRAGGLASADQHVQHQFARLQEQVALKNFLLKRTEVQLQQSAVDYKAEIAAYKTKLGKASSTIESLSKEISRLQLMLKDLKRSSRDSNPAWAGHGALPAAKNTNNRTSVKNVDLPLDVNWRVVQVQPGARQHRHRERVQVLQPDHRQPRLHDVHAGPSAQPPSKSGRGTLKVAPLVLPVTPGIDRVHTEVQRSKPIVPGQAARWAKMRAFHSTPGKSRGLGGGGGAGGSGGVRGAQSARGTAGDKYTWAPFLQTGALTARSASEKPRRENGRGQLLNSLRHAHARFRRPDADMPPGPPPLVATVSLPVKPAALPGNNGKHTMHSKRNSRERRKRATQPARRVRQGARNPRLVASQVPHLPGISGTRYPRSEEVVDVSEEEEVRSSASTSAPPSPSSVHSSNSESDSMSDYVVVGPGPADSVARKSRQTQTERKAARNRAVQTDISTPQPVVPRTIAPHAALVGTDSSSAASQHAMLAKLEQRHAQRVHMLVDMAKNISQDMSMPCVIDYVVDAARNLLEAMRVSVYFKDPLRHEFSVTTNDVASPSLDDNDDLLSGDMSALSDLLVSSANATGTGSVLSRRKSFATKSLLEITTELQKDAAASEQDTQDTLPDAGSKHHSILTLPPGSPTHNTGANTADQKAEPEQYVGQFRVPVKSDGVVGRVFQSAQAMAVDNVNGHAMYRRNLDSVPGIEVHSLLAVPLTCREATTTTSGGTEFTFKAKVKSFGVLVAYNKCLPGTSQLVPFTSQDQELLELLASLLRSARKFEQEKTVRQQKEGILKVINESVASVMDVDAVVQVIVKEVHDILDADRTTLFLVDHENNELVCHSSSQLKDQEAKSPKSSGAPPKAGSTMEVIDRANKNVSVGSGFTIPMVGLAGFVAKTGHVLNVSDAYEHPQFNSRVDKQTGYRTRSVVCVPVVDDNGNVFAVLQAINKKDQFSSVLSTSSDSKDTQDRPADAVGTADDATGAQTGADKSVPASRIVVSAAPEDASNSNGSPRSKRQSMPLDYPVFSEADVAVLQSLAHQIGSVIKSAQSIKAEQIARARSETLVDILKSMTVEVEPREVTKSIVVGTDHMVKPHRVTLYQIDNFSSELVCELSTAHVSGYRRPLGNAHDNCGGIVGHVAVTGDVINLRGSALASSPYFHAELDQTVVLDWTNQRLDTAAILAVPIKDVKGQVAGVIECVNVAVSPHTSSHTLRRSTLRRKKDQMAPDEIEDQGAGLIAHVMRKQQRGFSSADVDVVKVLANQTSVALHRAALYSTLVLNQKRNEALIEIVKAASEDIDVEQIIANIVQLAYKILPVDRVTLFLVDTIQGDLTCKISKDVPGFRVPKGKGVVGHVAVTGNGMNIPDAYECKYFNPSMDKKTGFRTQTILCLPVKDNEDQVVAVTQAINKRLPDGGVDVFNQTDAELLSALNHEIASVLKRKSLEATFSRVMDMPEGNTKAFIAQYMNRAVKDPTEDVEDVDEEFSEADDDEEKDLPAVIEEEDDAAIVDSMDVDADVDLDAGVGGTVDDIDPDDQKLSPHPPTTPRKPPDAGPDDPAVDNVGDTADAALTDTDAGGDLPKQAVSPTTSIATTNSTATATALAATVARPGSAGSVASKASASHKAGSSTRKTRSRLRAVVRTKLRLRRKQKQRQRRSTVKQSRNSSVSSRRKSQDARLVWEIDTTMNLKPLLDWEFDPFAHSDDELLKYAFAMFSSFNLLEIFQVDPTKLRNFLLKISENYRDNPYHNFRHGWSVLHCSFLIITTGGEDPMCTQASKYITITDVFATLIASYCHDVDHPGVNNAFHVNSEDPLAILYNDVAVLEMHHAALAFKIMYDPSGDYDILRQLQPEKRRAIRSTVCKGILATCIADHAKMTTELQHVAPKLSVKNAEDRQHMVDAIVHSSDLSNSAYPGPIAKQWADRIVEEFYNQSLLEKERDIPVTPFMTKRDLVAKANLNINFINYIVEPLWKILAKDCFPHLQKNMDFMAANKTYWQAILDENKKRTEEEEKKDSSANDQDAPTDTAGTTAGDNDDLKDTNAKPEQADESSSAAPAHARESNKTLATRDSVISISKPAKAVLEHRSSVTSMATVGSTAHSVLSLETTGSAVSSPSTTPSGTPPNMSPVSPH